MLRSPGGRIFNSGFPPRCKRKKKQACRKFLKASLDLHFLPFRNRLEGRKPLSPPSFPLSLSDGFYAVPSLPSAFACLQRWISIHQGKKNLHTHTYTHTVPPCSDLATPGSKNLLLFPPSLPPKSVVILPRRPLPLSGVRLQARVLQTRG